MKFAISEELANDYGDISIGILVARGVVSDDPWDRLEQLRSEVQSDIAQSGYSTSTLSQLPAIKAWRELFRSFGSKPSDYRSSVEALLRRVIRHDEIPRINSIVDLYNIVSLKHLVPMAGYNLDRISGSISLRYAHIGEKFTPLGGHEQEEIKKREVVYSDSEKIICRRWNHRDCEQTKISEGTNNIIFFIDGAPGFAENVNDALNTLFRHLKTLSNQKVRTHILSPSTGDLEWAIT